MMGGQASRRTKAVVSRQVSSTSVVKYSEMSHCDNMTQSASSSWIHFWLSTTKILRQ